MPTESQRPGVITEYQSYNKLLTLVMHEPTMYNAKLITTLPTSWAKG